MERALEGEHIESTALACILEGSMDRWAGAMLGKARQPNEGQCSSSSVLGMVDLQNTNGSSFFTDSRSVERIARSEG